jgi:acetyl esterase
MLTKPTFTFEADTAAFVKQVEQQPPTEGLSLEQLRTGYRDTVIKNSAFTESGVSTTDMVIADAKGSIPVRLYTPTTCGDKTSGLLIYIHGGGFAVGDLDSHDRLARLIATHLGNRILTLDYRRAPENPYPAAMEDVLSVYQWAHANADTLKIDRSRIALGGESAGATHAVASALAIGDRQLPRLKALWIFVPALDAMGTGASYAEFATGAGRTATEFAYLWSLYVPDANQRAQPGPSPFYAELKNLPPTYIYTAEFDPVRSEGEEFAKRIELAGGMATLQRKKGLVHQFPEITGISAASHQAVILAAKDLGAALLQSKGG